MMMTEASERVGDFAVRFALQYGWVDADVCHAVDLGVTDKRVIGMVLSGLHKRGFLRAVNYKKSRRSKCHYRPIVHYEVQR